VRRDMVSPGHESGAEAIDRVRTESGQKAGWPRIWRRELRRRWSEMRTLAGIVFRELIRTRVVDVAAGLAFWSLMSMIPLLMTAVALMSLLRLPELAPELPSVLAMLVPPDSLEMVEKMVGTLLTPHRGVLGFGVLSYVWSSTGGFTSLISALDVAYDVETERSWLRDRLQAVILTFTSGGLLTLSLLGLLAGPHFAHFVGKIVPVPWILERLWPAIRIVTVFVCFVVGLELVYFLGPNARQRFRSTLPGAIFAMAVWFVGSAGLSYYLDHFSGYSRMYGGMGAVIGLMVWTYLMALAILAGAELNAEMAKRRDVLARAGAGIVRNDESRVRPAA
jgi:membrane protein